MWLPATGDNVRGDEERWPPWHLTGASFNVVLPSMAITDSKADDNSKATRQKFESFHHEKIITI